MIRRACRCYPPTINEVLSTPFLASARRDQVVNDSDLRTRAWRTPRTEAEDSRVDAKASRPLGWEKLNDGRFSPWSKLFVGWLTIDEDEVRGDGVSVVSSLWLLHE